MTASAENVFAYHIGIVVRDIEPVSRLYTELLGVPRWHTWEVERDGLPTNPATAGKHGSIRIAYGHAPGQTIELLQPLSGTSVWSEFLRERGEGIQHIGVWTADLAAAVAEGLARGGRVIHGVLGGAAGAVQLSVASPAVDIVRALDPQQLAYIQPGAGGVAIEYVGPAVAANMRRTIGDDYDNVITSAPWA
jgi:catechol 2,3-dioxygenase-like lactoylglutathione lyase family enzyme